MRFPDDDGLERRKDADRGRPMLEILSEPGCVIAIATATIAHTSMVMLMTPMTLATASNDSIDFACFGF